MSGVDSNDSKVVQTVLDKTMYKHLRDIADERNVPIKQLVHDWLTDRLDDELAPNPDDPLFSFHDEHDAPEGGPQTSAENADDYIYGEPTREETE